MLPDPRFFSNESVSLLLFNLLCISFLPYGFWSLVEDGNSVFVLELGSSSIKIKVFLVKCQRVKVAELVVCLLYELVGCFLFLLHSKRILLFENVRHSLDSDHSACLSELAKRRTLSIF